MALASFSTLTTLIEQYVKSIKFFFFFLESKYFI